MKVAENVYSHLLVSLYWLLEGINDVQLQINDFYMISVCILLIGTTINVQKL